MAGLFSKKKTISSTENKIGALRIQNSSQGLPVPIVFGTTRITSNLLWFGDFTAIPHTESTKTGGKGGGGTTSSNTTYTYTCAVIFGMCEGPVFGGAFLGTVWSNKKVTNATALGVAQFQGGYAQSPWTYLTTNHSNQALNYRGDCYVAASAFDLGSSDGLPNLSWEVTGFLGAGDQNPADVITQMLTADKYGAGWPAPQLGDLTDFKAYCAAAGFLISPSYVAQQPMAQILTDLVQVGNAGVIWSDGLLKIKPYADTVVGSYTPDLTVQYDLGYSDFIAPPGTDPVLLDRKRQADAFNAVKVECLDRSNQYNTAVVEAKDQLAIDTFGLRPLQQVSAHAICNPAVARMVAQTILQRELYIRNVYTFTVGWRYGRLEPMDIVTLTDAALNLNKQTVRITSIEEDENGKLKMQAEELQIGVSSPGNYGAQTSNGSTPQNNNPPGNAIAPVMFQPPIALSGKPQIWLGTAGGPDWGGAQVWASHDGTTFENVGAVQGPARLGSLTANFPSSPDPDTTHTLSVNLAVSGGTLVTAANSVADALGTLSIVCDANGVGELLAYSAATLTGPNAYNLSGYTRRGQAGSNVGAHVTGDKFMRLDDAVSAFDVATSFFGTTVFVKLLSYNTTGNALQSLANVPTYSFNVVAQVVTNGSGFPFYADRASIVTANAPATGYMRFNNASQAFANEIAFSDLTAQGANLAAFFAALPQTGFLDLRDPIDSGKWATFAISAANQTTFEKLTVSYKAGGAEFPQGETVVATFSPSLPTGVVSVGLNMPTIFTVSNSPVISNGVFNVSLNTQNAALVWAGPVTGNAAAPTFRALALTDIPAGANTQVLTSQNGVAIWANAAGGGFANQIANVVFAGPSSGNAAAPGFRALALSDLPTTGAANTQVLTYSNGAAVWANVSAGNGGGNFTNPMTAAGDLIVGGANGAAGRLGVGTNGYVLTLVSNVPAWAPSSGGNGGGGGNGTSKVTAANVPLGNLTANSSAYTYTTLSAICARGLCSQFYVGANLPGAFDVCIRGTGNDAGTLFLDAQAIGGLTYNMSLPFYYENDAAAQDLFIGVRNRSSRDVSFNLVSIRLEKFA